MMLCFKTLLLTWLLQLTANNAEAVSPSHNSTDVMAGMVTGNSTEGQMTTNKASGPLLQDSDGFSPFITAKTPALNDQTTAASTNSTLSDLTSLALRIKTTTEEPSQSRETVPNVGTTLVITPTTATTVPLLLSKPTQGQNTGKTATSHKMSHMSTRPAVSTQPISTTSTATKAASTEPNQKIVTSTLTKVRKKPFKPRSPQGKNGPNHGKIVAGLIGAALIVMMLGFLLIFIKKRRIQKQQITTTDWAGPSPFLDNAAEISMSNQMSSNQISLRSFLPQRLSALQEMTGDTTFAEKHQGITFGQEVQSSDGQESNGSQVAPKQANVVSVTFSQTNNAVSKNDNSEAADHGQDSHPCGSESVESATE